MEGDRRWRGPVRSMAPRGFTLIELLAVLAIMGLALTLAVLRYAALPGRDDPLDLWSARLTDARGKAMRTGRIVAVTPPQGDGPVLFFPDGASSGGTVLLPEGRLAVDPVTGLIERRPLP